MLWLSGLSGFLVIQQPDAQLFESRRDQHFLYIFSSPEPLAHGELLLSLDVHCPSSTIASKESLKLLAGF